MAAIYVGAVVTITTPAGKGRKTPETITGEVVAVKTTDKGTGVVLSHGEGLSAVPLGVGTIVRCEHLSGAPVGLTDGTSEEVHGVAASVVREWARTEGIEVGKRGRVHPDLVARYYAAQEG